MDFKAGDVVRLRSGGPKMTVNATVTDTAGEPLIACFWFDISKKHQEANYAYSALELCNASEEEIGIFPKSAEEVIKHLSKALDGIEHVTNAEREKIIVWSDGMRNIGLWGLPGVEVMIGIHNHCVLECRNADPSWDRFDIFVA